MKEQDGGVFSPRLIHRESKKRDRSREREIEKGREKQYSTISTAGIPRLGNAQCWD